MSRTTRSTCPGGSAASRSTRSPTRRSQAGMRSGRRSSPRSSARWRRSRPAARTRSADRSARSARSREHGQRPRTRRRPRSPGPRGRCRRRPRSGPRPWGRPPPRRAASSRCTSASSGRSARYAVPPPECTTTPSGPPSRSSWAIAALGWCGTPRPRRAAPSAAAPWRRSGSPAPPAAAARPRRRRTHAGRSRLLTTESARSTTEHPPQSQLPPRSERVGRRPRPSGAVSTYSSDWVIGSSTRSAAAWRCRLAIARVASASSPMRRTPVLALQSGDCLGALRQRCVQVGLQPGQCGRGPRLAVQHHQIRRIRVGGRIDRPQPNTHPAGVLQSGADLGGDVLAVRASSGRSRG